MVPLSLRRLWQGIQEKEHVRPGIGREGIDNEIIFEHN